MIFVKDALASTAPLYNIYSPASVDRGGGNFLLISTYADLITPLIFDILVAMGVFSLLTLIFAGFQFVTAGGDKGKIDSARNMITYAIIGMIVAGSAYLITIIIGFIINFDFFNPTL